jgi:hypothetical protein
MLARNRLKPEQRVKLLMFVADSHHRGIGALTASLLAFNPKSLLPQARRKAMAPPGQKINDLFTGSDISFRESLGMNKSSFRLFKEEFERYGGLSDENGTGQRSAYPVKTDEHRYLELPKLKRR